MTISLPIRRFIEASVVSALSWLKRGLRRLKALNKISQQKASLWLLDSKSRWRLWGLSLSFHGILIIFMMISLTMHPQGGDRGKAESPSYVEISLSEEAPTIRPSLSSPAPVKPIESQSTTSPLKTTQGPKPIKPLDPIASPKPNINEETQKKDVASEQSVTTQDTLPSSAEGSQGEPLTDQPLNWAMIAPCWAAIGASKGISVTLTLTTGTDGTLSIPPEIVRPSTGTAPDEGRLTAEYLALHALATCGDTKALKPKLPTTITFLSQDDLNALSPQEFAAQGGVYY
jgi:hypothetical protein